jgi:hypothetical protein
MLRNKNGRCRPLIHIFGRLHLTLYDADDATKLALIDSETSNFLVIPSMPWEYNDEERIGEPGFGPASLTEIFKFDEMISHVERMNPSKKLVTCAGQTFMLQAQMPFLWGAI